MLPLSRLHTRNIRQDHVEESCTPNASGYCACPLEDAPEETAELVCSDTDIGPDHHKVLIDLDLPCKLVPSGTEGHFHLYIDATVSFKDYLAILTAMAEAGIVQWGYRDATEERGFGSLRHPDRPKGAPHADPK